MDARNAAGILLGAMFFFPILYLIVRSAVKDGILNALTKYEEVNNQKNKVE